MRTGLTIEALYFGYRPVAGHLDGCPRRGTDTWEVTRYTRLSFDGESRETVLRLACGQCCVLHFCSFVDGVARGHDQVTPIIERSLAEIARLGRGIPGGPAPLLALEVRDLLADLAEVLGADGEPVRLADLPPRRRKLAPSWSAYKTLTGAGLRQLLEREGTRTTNTGTCRGLTRPTCTACSTGEVSEMSAASCKGALGRCAKGSHNPANRPNFAAFSQVSGTVRPRGLAMRNLTRDEES
jgi:hypothetical protein